MANREIVERLQHAVARRFSNFAVPIKADRDVTDEDLKSHHLLIVGEPKFSSRDVDNQSDRAKKLASSMPDAELMASARGI